MIIRYNGENSIVIRHEVEERLSEAEARDREAIEYPDYPTEEEVKTLEMMSKICERVKKP